MLAKYATLWSILIFFFFCFSFWRSTNVQEAIMLLHMLLFGVFASSYAPFWGPNMLQRRDYAACEICYFEVFDASSFSLQPLCVIYSSFPTHLLWP